MRIGSDRNTLSHREIRGSRLVRVFDRAESRENPFYGSPHRRLPRPPSFAVAPAPPKQKSDAAGPVPPPSKQGRLAAAPPPPRRGTASSTAPALRPFPAPASSPT